MTLRHVGGERPWALVSGGKPLPMRFPTAYRALVVARDMLAGGSP